jgi:hypothetical protein
LRGREATIAKWRKGGRYIYIYILYITRKSMEKRQDENEGLELKRNTHKIEISKKKW